MAFDKNDIFVIALSSFTIGLVISIIITFAQVSAEHTRVEIAASTSQEFYNQIAANGYIGKYITVTSMPNITCDINDVNCKNGIRTESTITNTGFSVLEAKLNWGLLMTGIVMLAALLTVLPAIAYPMITQYTTALNDPFANLMIIIFLAMWQMMIAGVLFRIFILRK